MQAVITASFVVKQKRSRLLLASFVAACEKLLMFQRERLFLAAQSSVPLIGNFGEVRIGCSAKRLNDLRHRILEVLVVAFAETIALHDHVTSKWSLLAKKSCERCALSNAQQLTS